MEERVRGAARVKEQKKKAGSLLRPAYSEKIAQRMTES
jgi:hypothetical protein